MKTWKVLAALLAVSAAVFSCDSGGGSDGPPVLFSEDFSGYDVGDPVPDDWVYFDGQDNFSTVELAQKALYLSSGDAGNAVYNGAGAAGWTDYSLSFSLIPAANTGYFFINLRINPRPQPELTYYYLLIGHNGTDYIYYFGKDKTNATVYPLIGETVNNDLAFAAGVTYNIRVSAEGGRFRAYFNGSAAPFLDFTDPGASGPSGEAVITNGGFGFSRSSGSFYVDNIVLTEL